MKALDSHLLSRAIGVLICLVLVPGAFLWGWQRVHVETDLTSALPDDDPVVASARRIMGRHPALDLVTIDLSLGPKQTSGSTEQLLSLATKVQSRLEASGLFEKVGTAEMAADMPRLYSSVVEHLPQLFNASQLDKYILPRLSPDKIRQTLTQNLSELSELAGVGQAQVLARDPLRLRELVLARLAPLNPSSGARVVNGRVISGDGHHLLLVADPKGPGGDTDQARALVALLDQIQADIAPAELNAVGAYRSALDNETIVRADTQRAVWMATIGVALLLLLCFPRPWLGLLALVPALAGAALALFTYSLIESSISGLALGFGGALVAITVDHGIAYLQFLDRHQQTTGRGAAREIWAVGLFAALTTVGAFLALYFTGYPMLGQVGLFAALGVGFSFLFVHTVFPLLFPAIRPARRRSLLPVGKILSRVGGVKGFVLFACALALALGLTVVGRPDFAVDLNAMNTVKADTLAAESEVKRVWGDIFQRTYLLVEGDTLAQLRTRTDQLCSLLDRETEAGNLSSAFSPSQVLPGPDLSASNGAAWVGFFNPERTAALSASLRTVGDELGFAADAFEPFLRSLANPPARAPEIPQGLYPLLGIVQAKDGGWFWLSAVEPGSAYDAPEFAARAQRTQVAVFDPGLFTQRLSALLGSSFLDMLLIVGLAVTCLLVFLFFDLVLVAVALLPLVFALSCALGAMKLLGQPLDIPGLMLAVVVLGMGVDYALFFVRGQQRYFKPAAPGLGPIRMAVFLAAGSTMLGLGTLATADHSVPRSAGLTTLLGVGFALLGTFVLLPPLLNRLFAARPFPRADRPAAGPEARRVVNARFRHLEPGARMFARFKQRLDPMFPRLAELIGPARTIIDLGCGHGVPACWLLALQAQRQVHALEPDPERARVAERVLGEAGRVECLAAPDLGQAPSDADAAMALDMVHHLSDEDLAQTLSALARRLKPGGRLVLRATVPDTAGVAFERRLEAFRLRLAGRRVQFRTLAQLESALTTAGFSMLGSEPTAPDRAEHWLWAEVDNASSSGGESA